MRILGYPIAKEDETQEPSRADATFEGESLPISVVSSELTVLPEPILLAGRKAIIFVNWGFPNKMSCLYNGVRDVEVALWNQFGEPVFQRTFDCSLEAYAATLTPEEVRDFRGVLIDRLNNEPLNLEIFGYDVNNSATFQATQPLRLAPGEIRDITLVLEPCYDGCR